MAQRHTPRAATTGEHHAQLAGRLTLRDRWLARMLHEHKVFTTQQIVELCYPSMRAANHRLLDLFEWRVIDRFQPFVSSGTAPMHYVLDIAGAVALAYEDGLGIAHSLRLAHTVGINGFFTTLIALSRQSGARGRLTAWWSELHCGRLFGDMVRPDAYGRWREDGQQIEFFLEFDFGTEDLATLGRKLYGYEKLATATGSPPRSWYGYPPTAAKRPRAGRWPTRCPSSTARHSSTTSACTSVRARWCTHQTSDSPSSIGGTVTTISLPQVASGSVRRPGRLGYLVAMITLPNGLPDS
ncbi:hypothetical protein GCM10017566_24810 [Amycolatopsis bartoniae]|uniref:Replication-relaxation n=1 Tax=Amycolatopsis bartoniae TaxID=941986 RepID=A0A8H9MC33_9PSEU|nr:hypothetical protein GCM10017566_24810 [Amycolatopsis bartoniae]